MYICLCLYTHVCRYVCLNGQTDFNYISCFLHLFLHLFSILIHKPLTPCARRSSFRTPTSPVVRRVLIGRFVSRQPNSGWSVASSDWLPLFPRQIPAQFADWVHCAPASCGGRVGGGRPGWDEEGGRRREMRWQIVDNYNRKMDFPCVRSIKQTSIHLRGLMISLDKGRWSNLLHSG